ARQPAKRDTGHHQQAQPGDHDPDEDEGLSHPPPLLRSYGETGVASRGRNVKSATVQRSSMPRKKYPSSKDAVSAASDPCVALNSIDAPKSFLSVPASALAGSVAPIRVRHFLMASGA